VTYIAGSHRPAPLHRVIIALLLVSFACTQFLLHDTRCRQPGRLRLRYEVYIVSVVARARRDAKLRFPCYAVTITGDNILISIIGRSTRTFSDNGRTFKLNVRRKL